MLKQHANCQGWRSLTTEYGLQKPVRKQAKEDGRKMELLPKTDRRKEGGTEYNKGEGRDKRLLAIHAKPPPAASGDQGSGDQEASPCREGKGGARWWRVPVEEGVGVS